VHYEHTAEARLTHPDSGDLVTDVSAIGGTVWLTQGQMADLYGTSRQNVQQVIARVLSDGEVDESTVNSELTVRAERRLTKEEPPAGR